ncbi:hypothetical protein ACNOYE_03955 [Nannocystaceae bacterium ST9]
MRRNSMLVMAASWILCVSACKPKEEPVAPEDDTWIPDEGREPAPAPVAPPAPELSEDERQAQAKAIYVEAEGKAKAEDWAGALVLYEQAYHLVPGKHGFALKVATTAERAGDCAKAILFYEHFVQYAEPDKYGEDIAKAKTSVAALKKQGC